MATYRHYTMDEIWQPPTDNNVVLGQTGCPFMDAFCAGLRRVGYKPLKVMARHLDLTPDTLSGTIEGVTGMSYGEWSSRWMIRDAKWLLAHTRLAAGEIGRRLGFASASNFGQAFRLRTGVSPGLYRKQHQRIIHRISVESIADDE